MWTPDKSIIVTAEQRAAEANEAQLIAFRAERNRRLAATDWVILRNLETSDPVPQVWMDYRQALRDLPDNTDDPNNPAWPKEP